MRVLFVFCLGLICNGVLALTLAFGLTLTAKRVSKWLEQRLPD